ncbi:hypothetical protein DXG01_009695, partial [Tephrocybe rancida]
NIINAGPEGTGWESFPQDEMVHYTSHTVYLSDLDSIHSHSPPGSPTPSGPRAASTLVDGAPPGTRIAAPLTNNIAHGPRTSTPSADNTSSLVTNEAEGSPAGAGGDAGGKSSHTEYGDDIGNLRDGDDGCSNSESDDDDSRAIQRAHPALDASFPSAVVPAHLTSSLLPTAVPQQPAPDVSLPPVAPPLHPVFDVPAHSPSSQRPALDVGLPSAVPPQELPVTMASTSPQPLLAPPDIKIKAKLSNNPCPPVAQGSRPSPVPDSHLAAPPQAHPSWYGLPPIVHMSRPSPALRTTAVSTLTHHTHSSHGTTAGTGMITVTMHRPLQLLLQPIITEGMTPGHPHPITYTTHMVLTVHAVGRTALLPMVLLLLTALHLPTDLMGLPTLHLLPMLLLLLTDNFLTALLTPPYAGLPHHYPTSLVFTAPPGHWQATLTPEETTAAGMEPLRGASGVGLATRCPLHPFWTSNR